MYVTVIPAYGRDYRNQKDVRSDWAAGKDFIETASRKYINKADAEAAGLRVIVRYGNLRKVVEV